MADSPAREEDLGFVYYATNDYAGFLRRLVVIVVDCLVLACGYLAGVVVLTLVDPEAEPSRLFFGVYFGAVLLYLTVVKRSRLRTVGYWVAGVRIVNLRGERPGMFFMTLRLLWWVLGPLNPVIDLLFMTNEEHGQTLRDKLVGTYVIRRSAQPVGHGRRVISRWGFMGMFFMFPEVEPVKLDSEPRTGSNPGEAPEGAPPGL